MTEKLKSCPFCGGEATVVSDFIDGKLDIIERYKVVCLKCMGWCEENRDKAIMLWNRRKYKYSHSLFKKLRRRRNHG